MTPRDRLQRLLFEHRTAHDPASSEREILRMFEDAQKPRDQMVDADSGVPSEMDNVRAKRRAVARPRLSEELGLRAREETNETGRTTHWRVAAH